MTDTIVIYGSKYGTTKKYAEWIGEALPAEVFENKKVQPEQLTRYRTIIYGGGLYAGGICGVSLITKNFEALKGKNLIVFTCGLADPADQENIKGIYRGIDRIFTPEMKEKIVFFHLRGGVDYRQLSMIHKSMMAMLKKKVEKKDYNSLSCEEKQILETYGGKVDFTDKAMIAPILELVKGYD